MRTSRSSDCVLWKCYHCWIAETVRVCPTCIPPQRQSRSTKIWRYHIWFQLLQSKNCGVLKHSLKLISVLPDANEWNIKCLVFYPKYTNFVPDFPPILGAWIVWREARSQTWTTRFRWWISWKQHRNFDQILFGFPKCS